MMKSLKYLLISFLAILATSKAFACWDPWYSPSGHYMYRVSATKFYKDDKPLEFNPSATENCRSWQHMTSTDIPMQDIYQVVYKMSLEDLEKLKNNSSAKYDNKFAEWITKRDTDILDFLLLAKTNEHIRQQVSSKWYYPTMKIKGVTITLDELVDKALSNKSPRLRDRYLLQAIRSLTSLSKYNECIDLWNSEISLLPEDNLMRKLCHPYIAGAEFHTGQTDKAMSIFAELGDIESLLYCAEKKGEKLSTIGALELVCKYAPNSSHIPDILQTYVRSFEPEGLYGGCISESSLAYYEEQTSIRAKALLPLCINMAQNPEVNNPAIWYYTTAILQDMIGNTTKASLYLGLAENSKSNKYIDESISVMRIYLDAKLSTYDSAYEAKLFKQLKWLDAKIVSDIDESVRKEVSHSYPFYGGLSFYYWNDMLRRIVLAEVCPRMLKAGKTIRALQLANMADNRLLGFVNKRVFYGYAPAEEGKGYDYEEVVNETLTMSQYRYSEHFNTHDYSNHFFEMIDSLGVNTAIRYVDRVKKPISEFDKYLNARGYTGDDYLSDIVGTQCLRNMRYKDAVKYLGAVSEAYKHHHNVYVEYDPFSIERKEIKTQYDFRYTFAKEMFSLEQCIEMTTDPSVKARLMLKYAIGLHNSFDRCWGLTQYYKGSAYWGCVCEKREWETEMETISAIKKSNDMIATACDIVTDDEVAADIHYQLCNFKTVAERYPNSQKAEVIRSSCDKLYDYHAEKHW